MGTGSGTVCGPLLEQPQAAPGLCCAGPVAVPELLVVIPGAVGAAEGSGFLGELKGGGVSW